jgi:tetratricopeptide (TPR) repeat protein
MVQVAYSLHRRPEAAPAEALLLLTGEAADVAAFLARLGADPLPQVHAVAGGFLLCLDRPLDGSFPPAIRLRRLAPNLYLPADADLAPTLLDDEATGLTRERGLVFLPAAGAAPQVLAFAPERPLPLSALLTAPALRRRAWQAFPRPRQAADRIEEILLDLPPTADDLLAAGGAGIGEDDPRPDAGNAAGQILGQAAMGAGKGLLWLGNLTGLKGLGQAGANLVQQALNWAPRLSESIIGRQEAALRDLLRQFREGHLEQALRRALPLGSPGDARGGVPAAGAQLPTHNLTYSLSRLLGGSGRGPAAIWFGGQDVQRALAEEYRKAAEDATRRGDPRRAAFIYGRLLGEYRLAAQVLANGGLHHDAAVLYLEKVGDLLRAAEEFEAAGEADRALQIYRQGGHHLKAGDLLRRLGDDDGAVAEYTAAADRLARDGQHLQAGDLALSKTGRGGLAVTYWNAGWSLRQVQPGGAVACAVRLVQFYGDRPWPDPAEPAPPPGAHPLLALQGEAEAHFNPSGDETLAGQFYNAVAQAAAATHLAELRGELRDRTLQALAHKLRQRAAEEQRPGDAVSRLLGQGTAWAAPVVSDAHFAFKAAFKAAEPPAERAARGSLLRLAEGTVTAVAHAPHTGAVFVGFADGQVFGYRPATGAVDRLPFYHQPVTHLATDPDGAFVAILRVGPVAYLAGCVRPRPDAAFEVREGRVLTDPGPHGLAPLVVRDHDWLTGLVAGDRLRLLRGPRLTPSSSGPLKGPAAWLLPRRSDQTWLTADLDDATLWINPGVPTDPIDYRPHTPLWPVPQGPRRAAGAGLAWLQTDHDRYEVVGVDAGGVLRWAALRLDQGAVAVLGTTANQQATGYLATALVRPGFVVGVTAREVFWLRAGAKGFTWYNTTRQALPRAVACFPLPHGHEVLVVNGDGTLARVPVPT